MRLITLVLIAAGALAAQETRAKKVTVTLPVIKTVADELAGGAFDVVALSKPNQDPHAVSPTPALMKNLREADLFLEIGLSLELWADEVANGSGNPGVQRGAKGRVVVTTGVPREEIPTQLTREQGDIHPEGNPHVWLDPIRVRLVAENIAAALVAAAPDQKSAVEERLKRFHDRIDEALFGADLIKAVGRSGPLLRKAQDGTLIAWLEERKLSDRLGGWMKKALPLRGRKAVEHHKTWVYFARLFGIELVGSIQPKPGIDPTARHLDELKTLIDSRKVGILIVDNFYRPDSARWLAERTSAKVAILPNQPGGESGTDDYFRFIDYILDRLLEVAK